MDPELKEALADLEGRINRRFEALEERMAERIESTETKLLTAFHDWARTHEVRSRGLSSLVIGFEERLTIIEDRLSKLERRPNGGGPHTTN